MNLPVRIVLKIQTDRALPKIIKGRPFNSEEGAGNFSWDRLFIFSISAAGKIYYFRENQGHNVDFHPQQNFENKNKIKINK